ncbi:MAG TPA: hypothetical protein VFS21_07240 [Roseiflexaceae bacterium]|nr:hypothetical protein [Roseiflexaceae bacterium]
MDAIIRELIKAVLEGRTPRFTVKPFVRIKGGTLALLVAVDFGNDAAKGAVFDEEGNLHTIRIPTAYQRAEAIQAGQQEVSYSLGGESFWVGQTALRHRGDPLDIGPSVQRFQDGRLIPVLAATIVELLRSAGYAPGNYTIALGFAIPNNEIQLVPKDDGTEKLGVIPEVQKLLLERLKGATWTVERQDEQRNSTTWSLNVATVAPQAQTAGTVLVYTKAANGRTVTRLEGLKVIDIGGGDLQDTEVRFDPYQIISRRRGDGTIRIAREMKGLFPSADLNDVAAQHALVSRRLMVSGQTRDISPQVEQLLASKGSSLISDILPSLRQTGLFVVITGGGVILLNGMLENRLLAENKKPMEDYELIDPSVASVLNAIGALFGTLFLISGRE